MNEIKTTRIATSYPIDICQGIALFPLIGTMRAGKTFSQPPDKPILTVRPTTILLWRFSATANYRLLAGVCGPAYAASFDIAGQSDGRAVELTVTNDQVAAGIFAGVVVSFPVTFAVDQGTITWSWPKGFGTKWHRALTKTASPSVDVLETLVEIIRTLLKEESDSSDVQKGKQEEGEPEENKQDDKKRPKVSVPTWGIYDHREDTFNAGKGVVTPEPTFSVSIDIVPMIPQLRAVDAGLKALWGNFSLGPRLKLIVPVAVQFHRVFLDQSEVTGLTYRDGKLIGQTDTAVEQPTTLRVELDHSPSFTVGMSLFLSVSICKLFSFSPETPDLRLDKLLGLQIKAGTYCAELANTIGELAVGSQGPQQCGTGKVEVILDP